MGDSSGGDQAVGIDIADKFLCIDSASPSAGRAGKGLKVEVRWHPENRYGHFFPLRKINFFQGLQNPTIDPRTNRAAHGNLLSLIELANSHNLQYRIPLFLSNLCHIVGLPQGLRPRVAANFSEVSATRFWLYPLSYTRSRVIPSLREVAPGPRPKHPAHSNCLRKSSSCCRRSPISVRRLWTSASRRVIRCSSWPPVAATGCASAGAIHPSTSPASKCA